MFDEDHVIYRYKYLPFDEGSLKTLTEGTIKFTCPLDFNDPFDCMPHYDTTSINQITTLRPELFKAAGERRGLSPANRLQKKGEFVARLKSRVSDGSFAEDILRGVGVLSLSKEALNVPMWSHYAHFHTGIVLEFRIPLKGELKDVKHSLNRLLPFPVKYQACRPQIEIGKEYPPEFVNSLVLTKNDVWKYEDEERVIDNERGPGIHAYSRDEILCTVIAGLKMDAKNFQRLETIVKNLTQTTMPNLMLFKATEKHATYELEVKNHPRLEAKNS